MREGRSLAPLCRKSPGAPSTRVTCCVSELEWQVRIEPRRLASEAKRGYTATQGILDALMPRVFQQGPRGTSSLSGVSLVDVGGWGGGSVSRGGGTAGPVPPTPTPCTLAHKGRCTRSTPASRVCPTHRPVKDRCRGPPPSWPGPIWQALPEAPVSSLGPLWAVSDRELGPVRHTSTQTEETGSRGCGICYH